MQDFLYFLPKIFRPQTKLRLSAKDIVINHVKSKILSRELLPGDKLPIEDKLAEQLQVGRGSVREAIKVLQSIGVVDIKRGSGTFVTQGDISKALEPLLFSVILSQLSENQIIELRFMFETAIFENIINNISEKQIDSLESQINTMQKEIESSEDLDAQRLVELDFDFHASLAEAADNPLVEGLYRVILCLSFPFMKQDYAGTKSEITAVSNHRMICAALRARDINKAKESISYSMWHSHKH